MNKAKVHTAGLLAPSFAYLWALDYTGHGPPLEPLCCLFLLPGMLSHQLFQVCLIYEWGNWVQRNDALLCNRQLQSGKVFPGSQISWFLIFGPTLIIFHSYKIWSLFIGQWLQLISGPCVTTATQNYIMAHTAYIQIWIQLKCNLNNFVIALEIRNINTWGRIYAHIFSCEVSKVWDTNC